MELKTNIKSSPARDPVASWILLLSLSLVYVYSLVDRSSIQFLVEPIKRSLAIGDTQFSLLSGIAFLMIFAIAALPMGYLIDRVNRIWLIAAGIAVWSFGTALCGLTASFAMLFLARGLVGVGEAVLAPAGYALLADSFDKRRHSLVLSLFACAGSSGGGLGFIVGGLIVARVLEHGDYVLFGSVFQPWQVTFFLLGLPGFLIALAFLLLREPRPASLRRVAPERKKGAVQAFIKANARMLALHHVAVGLLTMAAYGAGQWVAVFFMRVHGWPISKVGFWVGLTMIGGGIIGFLTAGAAGDRVLSRGPHMRLVLCAVCQVIAAAFAIAFPLIGNANLAMLFYGFYIVIAVSPLGVANAALQYLVPQEIRGSISSIYFFVMNIISAGGPVLVAAVAETYFPEHSGIRYSLAIVIPSLMALAAICFFACIPFYRRAASELGEAIDSQRQSALEPA